ncbi:FAD-binding oxidoreductase [Marinithermus hydrothermalis]|uniref:D-lactate dehydrogenase (Cytochrome) n=1 Tax=Marinithermus hydrothermalis (strain DSM 14884 / JCM 11576 / T1) TaxID=869210 RepID=F2NM91_MARHT|nr:FAD-linked oxidase C-terminal domain-containing protein [Marinithermus hydrothermalis]AEB11779.1 D-lactate dehydrogenase (cytochrome) [Marinithermus hydrothermalis DSM 14884]
MAALESLRQALGPRKVLLDLADRILYRYDAIDTGVTPLAVVLPETTQDVVETLRFAQRAGIPVVPRGSASGLSGGAVPVTEAIVLATNRMTRLKIDPERRVAYAQPGVVTARVSEAAAPYGLYYPPDPASYRQSTIGGNLAENAGGPQCFKKGVTGDYVLELEFVTADGAVHRVGREAYDIAGLLIGSEGTLGVITDSVLRLEPRPRYTRTLMGVFAELEALAEAVARAVRQGAVPAKMEFMDRRCVRAVEEAFALGLPTEAGALLLVDTDGDDLEVVEEELEWMAEACRAAGGVVRVARDAAEAAELWRARRAVSPALGRIRPQRMNEDIVVPRSKLPAVVREILAAAERYPFPLVLFGHIGDGNLHPNILYDPRVDDTRAVMELAHEIARIALQHGGVLSGEHGIGTMKRPFMREALDETTLGVLRDLKRALDPEGLLNPGKVLPD